jgi:pimeloyl-ACP methyl ester carboxylesterase
MVDAEKPTITPGRRVLRLAWRVSRAVLIAYVLVLILFGAFQTKMIFPGAATQGRREAVVNPPPETELLELKAADGTKIAALFGKSLAISRPDLGQKTPTVIWFYGNAMCLNDAIGEFQQFRKLGANVLAVEYAGYGMSGGSAGEEGCYMAAEAGYQHLLSRTDIDSTKILAGGWSLGGGAAIHLAWKHRGEGKICGVMTFSAFSSLGDVARFHYPGVPVGMLLRHKFESEKKIAEVGVPVLLGHGVHDEISPFWMMEKLATAAERGGVEVTRVKLESAAHNDFFVADEAAIDVAVGEFLMRVGK